MVPAAHAGRSTTAGSQLMAAESGLGGSRGKAFAKTSKARTAAAAPALNERALRLQQRTRH